jgi:hypothetical protein
MEIDFLEILKLNLLAKRLGKCDRIKRKEIVMEIEEVIKKRKELEKL